MRIIAGEFRGRKLLPPQSDATRPVTDRVKQSVFDILTTSLDGAIVYDCFAGTGSMGLECLSRGARHVTFFEADRSAGKRLRQNINALQIDPRCAVQPGDLFSWFTKNCLVRQSKVDLIFLDPPYRYLRERPAELQAWATAVASGFLAENGLVIFRHDAADELPLASLPVVEVRTYGAMAVEFLRAAKP